MNLSLVENIANAVLYEGYILYPYRPSSVKNQRRWSFGALCPRAYSEAQRGTEAWTMQTECLVHGNDQTALSVKVRFLHLLMREVGVRISGCGEKGALSRLEEDQFRSVAALEVGGQIYQTWQEAVERQASVQAVKLGELAAKPRRVLFSFLPGHELEPLSDQTGELVGVIVRKQQAIEGAIEISAERAGDNLFKVAVRILNLTSLENADETCRDGALLRAFVSTHTILTVNDGEFVSLLDPSEEFREVVTSCNNVGTWPVLVGEEGERDMMLSSPIILYDYPQIAPESAGDLFDGTEIDEILTLRIMTLTDEEKREMRGVDERARQLLERTETLPMEQVMRMHGAMRSVKPKEQAKEPAAGEVG